MGIGARASRVREISMKSSFFSLADSNFCTWSLCKSNSKLPNEKPPGFLGRLWLWLWQREQRLYYDYTVLHAEVVFFRTSSRFVDPDPEMLGSASFCRIRIHIQGLQIRIRSQIESESGSVSNSPKLKLKYKSFARKLQSTLFKPQSR